MLFLITSLIVVSGAMAQVDLRPYNLSAAILFVNNDLNNDSKLSLPEFDQVFRIYDFNGDKIIDRHEYVCYLTKGSPQFGSLAHALYDEYDANHDHKLQRSDYDAFFAKMDQDGDKVVSDVEFIRYWEALFVITEKYSLHGHQHPQHVDKYCQKHGHAH